MLIDKLAACKFFYKFRNIYLIPYGVIQKKIMFFYQHLCSINLYGLLIKLCFPTTFQNFLKNPHPQNSLAKTQRTQRNCLRQAQAP